jgi:hypothetical protein
VLRLCATWAILLGSAATALAQPVDPYGPPKDPAGVDEPTDPYAPPPLDNAVAQALVTRARQLLEADFAADAKLLAEEALVRSPDGDVAVEARAIIEAANKKLGIVPEPPVDPVKPPDKPPIDDIVEPPPLSDYERDLRRGRRALAIHGGLVGATIGGGIGLAASDESPGGTVAGVVVGGALGIYGGRWAASRWKIDEVRARAIGSGAHLGAVTIALFADVVKVDGTTASEVAVGATLGTAVGLGAGALVSRGDRLSTGDVALMDSFAAYGVIGGLTLGLAMDPAESEAYSLNAVLGGIGGWMLATIAGPSIEASPRRVMRMNLGALVGGATPWLIYALASDDSTSSDEQAFGFLSTAGIVAGAYLGYRWSKSLAGDEKRPQAKRSIEPPPVSAPTALLRRDASGWNIAPIVPRPLAATQGRGVMIDLFGGAF